MKANHPKIIQENSFTTEPAPTPLSCPPNPFSSAPAYGIGEPSSASPPMRSVTFNGELLTEERLRSAECLAGKRFANGAYWYDDRTGAWGLEGNAPSGKLPPNLRLGGPLREDASGGSTGVFINGREITLGETLRLRLAWIFPPDRYHLDSEGNFGVEGGPVLGNLRQLAYRRAKIAAIVALGGLAVVAASNRKICRDLARDRSCGGGDNNTQTRAQRLDLTSDHSVRSDDNDNIEHIESDGHRATFGS